MLQRHQDKQMTHEVTACYFCWDIWGRDKMKLMFSLKRKFPYNGAKKITVL